MGDSDTFYRLFGKPTLIYKFLRTQHLVSPLFLHRNLSYVKTRQEKNRKPRSAFRLENFQRLKQERVIKNAREKEIDLELITLGIEQYPKHNEDSTFKVEFLAKNSLVEIPLDSFGLRAKGQQYSYVLSSRRLKKEGFVKLECAEILVRVVPCKEVAEPEAKRPRPESLTAVVTPFSLSYSVDGEYHFPLKESPAGSETPKLGWDETPYVRIKFRWRRRSSNTEKNGVGEENKENLNKDSKLKKILYYYNAGGNSVQTQALSGYNCPWCYVDGRVITGLIMHLKHNHFRFKFSHVEKADYHCIEVSVNEHFDGSFAGNPQRTALHPSSNRRKRPLRCLARSEVIVWNNKKQRQNGELDDDFEHQRPSIFGHQRLYYHTGTCMPIGSEGIDVDSEGEIDPEWLQVKTQMMIDEFTDVNSGEKEMWKMWNLFKMKHNFVGDKQMAFALNQFITSCGTTLVKRDMVRNFLVHTSGFFDFGVTTQYSTLRSVSDLRLLLAKDPELRNQFAKNVERQIAFAKESRKEKAATTTDLSSLPTLTSQA